MATRKRTVRKPTKQTAKTAHSTGRKPVGLAHDPKAFIQQIIDDVIFQDASLEEADKRIAEYFEERTEREREQMGRVMIPLVSRLASASPSIASMVTSRAR